MEGQRRREDQKANRVSLLMALKLVKNNPGCEDHLRKMRPQLAGH